jgi:glycosyltransferase involved in cell wall biosynthesis
VKLIVQIPCYNEETTLPAVIASIPREIDGIDQVEVLVVDDGSTDRTAAVARLSGANHVVRHRANRGLADAFQTGLDACLKLGADIIVNTDGDNQYPQADIPRLIEPILKGRADVVVGDRQPSKIPHFSRHKKLLQALGSWTVRFLSGTNVPDAPSGFRAYSREAAMRLNVVTKYTYTIETLIQAGIQRTAIASVPISVKETKRQSRLAKSLWSYVKQSAATIVRTYAMYQPLKVFFYIGIALSLLGLLGSARFLYYYFSGDGGGHVQSLILSAVLLIVGFQIMLIGLLADLIAANRKLLENTLYRVKIIETQLARQKSQDGENEDAGNAGDFGDHTPSVPLSAGR